MSILIAIANGAGRSHLLLGYRQDWMDFKLPAGGFLVGLALVIG
jgi:hypothetical protein